MKFYNESDFVKALDIMQKLGLPVTDNIPSAQPPTILNPSLASSARPSSALSVGTTVSSSRTASANTCYTPTTDLHLDTSSTPALKSDFKVPLRPDPQCSETPKPIGATSYSDLSFLRPTLVPSTSSILEPTTPSIYISQAMKEVCRVAYAYITGS